MRGEDRHPHRGRRNQQFGLLEDLPDLVDQLDFLARVSALDKFVDMRNQVERNLMRKKFRLDRLALRPRHRLLAQFRNPIDARAGDRLETGRDHAPETPQVVDRLERHHGDDRRAIRTGHDALVTARGGGVDLGHHQRHVGVHSIGARLVHDDRARLDRDRCELARLRRARREQRDIDSLERVGVRAAAPLSTRPRRSRSCPPIAPRRTRAARESGTCAAREF